VAMLVLGRALLPYCRLCCTLLSCHTTNRLKLQGTYRKIPAGLLYSRTAPRGCLSRKLYRSPGQHRRSWNIIRCYGYRKHHPMYSAFDNHNVDIPRQLSFGQSAHGVWASGRWK
jgi:hypothetical protein